MATAGGPDIEKDGLVFGYDTGRNPSSNFDHRINKRRHFRGKPTVNFFPDGHFPDGTDMSSEAGSNAQNDVIILKNPGDSPYVLRQTMGVAYTEYQINLTTELAANTTYVLSGWYAESTDYNASSRMFHCRAHSTGGNHRALGNGIYNVISTKIVNGITWRHCYATITTPSDYNNNFNWYVGYSNDSYSGARYYTNLKMEQGSYPTPYVAGTRSSTQSLIDLTKITDIDVSNVSFDSTGLPTFDGTDDYIDISNHGITSETSLTVLYWFKMNWISSWSPFITLLDSNGTQKFHTWFGSDRGIDFQTSINSVKPMFSANSSSYPNNEYINIVMTVDGTGSNNVKCYVNGVYKAQGSLTFNSHNITNLRIGRDPGNAYGGGDMPVVRIYDRALSAEEIQQNYNAYKNRFNL